MIKGRSHKLLNFKCPYLRLHNTYALCFWYAERHWRYFSPYQKQSTYVLCRRRYEIQRFVRSDTCPRDLYCVGVIKHKKTAYGIIQNGTYRIQPSRSVASFEVECKFGSGDAVPSLQPTHSNGHKTTARPNSEKGCAQPGCYTDTIMYDIAQDQLQVIFIDFL